MSSVSDLINELPEGKARLPAAFGVLRAWGFARAVFAEFAADGTGTLRGASEDYPNDWLELYVAQGYALTDPVLGACRRSVVPVGWETVAGRSEHAAVFFDRARAHGVGRRGLTFPVHGPGGRLALLSVSGEDTDAQWGELVRERISDVSLLACHLFEAEKERRGDRNLLSAREAECLRWSAEGKTLKDIAAILGLSERTVRFHLENARRKLDALNTRHAAAIAVRRRLIPYG